MFALLSSGLETFVSNDEWCVCVEVAEVAISGDSHKVRLIFGSTPVFQHTRFDVLCVIDCR